MSEKGEESKMGNVRREEKRSRREKRWMGEERGVKKNWIFFCFFNCK